MVTKTITEIADNLAKELAKSFGKHLGAQMGTKQYGGRNAGASQYEEVKGRGGDLDSGPDAYGGVPDTKKFKQSVEDISAVLDRGNKGILRGSMDGAAEIVSNVKRIFSGGGTELRMDKLLAEANDFASEQVGIYKQIAESTVKYIKKPDTDIKELSRVSDALSDFRALLHKTTRDGIVDKNEAKQLRKARLALRDLEDKRIDVLEEMTTAERKHYYEIERGMLNQKKINKNNPKEVAAYNAQMAAVHKLSKTTEDAAHVMVDVGSAVTDNLLQMNSQFKAKMWKMMQIAGAGVVTGGIQLYSDTVYQYQISQGRQFKKMAIGMGMSHRAVQDGLLDFRDTLRVNAAAMNKGLYDEQGIKDIQKLGKTFAMIGEDAFVFGMQLHESAANVGLSSDLNAQKMADFMGDAAKTMNMSVGEFSTYFNNLSKDEGFIGFASTLRATGGTMQDALMKEMKTRIKMNKLMGLSNEQMQARIAMDSAKRTDKIESRWQSRTGVAMLIRQYEKRLGVKMDPKDKQIALTHATFGPGGLSPSQLKIFNERIDPMLTAGPRAVIDSLMKKQEDETLTDKERDRLNFEMVAANELLQVSGELAGDRYFNMAASDKAVTKLDAVGEEDTAYVMQQYLDGILSKPESDVPNPLLDKLTGLMGGDEATRGLSDGTTGLGGFTDALVQATNAAIEFSKGAASSGVAKAGLGVLSAVGGIIFEIYKMKGIANLLKGKSITHGMGKMTMKAGTKVAGMVGLGGIAAKMSTKATAAAAEAAMKSGTKVGAKGTQALAEAAAKKGAAAIAAKSGGKMLGKKIPIIGALIGAGLAVDRMMDGDMIGAGMELLSGAASIIPGVGTAASVAIDAGLMAKDIAAANDETAENLAQTTAEQATIAQQVQEPGAQKAIIADAIEKMAAANVVEQKLGTTGKTPAQLQEEANAILAKIDTNTKAPVTEAGTTDSKVERVALNGWSMMDSPTDWVGTPQLG